MNEEQALEREIRELEERLKDRELALPAHSVRPHQLLIIEELEEEIREKKSRLAACREQGGGLARQGAEKDPAGSPTGSQDPCGKDPG
ncbi:MAG: hypothetical protein JW821_06005 [Deltaproteobacteria bacterium]|nr:hypothetical protein [Deltaproteobacteria bacterium]